MWHIVDRFAEILKESIEALKALGLVHLVEDAAMLVKYNNQLKTGAVDDHSYNPTAKLIGIMGILYEKDPNSDLLRALEKLMISSLWEFLHKEPKKPHAIGPVPSYRSADGTGYSVEPENFGMSGSAYTHDVPRLPSETLKDGKTKFPSASDVFDKILARTTFKPHPCGLSSSVFHMATLITHDLFNTDYNTKNNKTTSYIDASWLYGWNQTMQDSVRDKASARGKLFQDTLADPRFTLQPPGVVALAILFCRNHNFIADELYKRRDEESRFKDLSGAPLDEQLFQTARAINIAMYANIVLHDYLRALMGITRTESAWALQPNEKFTTNDIPCAVGNNCSIEFNFIYRWHSAISENDEKWLTKFINGFMRSDNATYTQIMDKLTDYGKRYDDPTGKPKPTEVNFFAENPQQRRPLTSDGKATPYPDQTIAAALQSAIESPAGSFGGRNIPQIMKAIEVLGILGGREGKSPVCTMNDYRRWLKLKPFGSFEELNSDPNMVAALKELYVEIENVELYPGLVAEQAMKVEPGVGLASGYTIVTAILSDAVALVRGDRFLTVDHTPENLTKWGFEWCKPDPTVNKGGLIGSKIIPNTLPGFPSRWIGTVYPFCTPQANEKLMPEKVRHGYEINFPVVDYRIHNSSGRDLKIQQVFRCLEVTGKTHVHEGDIVPILKGQRVVLAGNRPYSHEEERLLVVYEGDSKEEHSLVGLPRYEQCIIPLPKAHHAIGHSCHRGNFELVPAESCQAHLLLSAMLDSEHALSVIQNDPEMQRGIDMQELLAKKAENNLPSVQSAELLAMAPPNIPVEILRYRPENGSLNPNEEKARNKRMENIKKLVPHAPKIALCTSGGGMRAMLSSIGFLIGMKEIGVLDLALYMCGLSGSTWSLSHWMNCTTNPFVDDKRTANTDPWSSDTLNDIDLTKILSIATSTIFEWITFEKYLWPLAKSRSLLYVYADVLGKKFKVEKEAASCAQWREKADSGKYPIPICTSCIKEDGDVFQVIDHTPYEIGGPFLSTYFEPDSYTLENYKYTAPMSINNMMAIWGSVFYADFDEIFPSMPEWLRKLIGERSLNGAKVLNANYNKKNPTTGELLPLANQQYLYYRDCGIYSNVPVAPMMLPEREIDLIIVFDTTEGVHKHPFQELVRAMCHRKIDLKLPADLSSVQYPHIIKKTEYHPTIIYMPLLELKDLESTNPLFGFDPSHSNTFKFSYPEGDATKLIQLAHETVLRAKSKIWETINKPASQQP